MMVPIVTLIFGFVIGVIMLVESIRKPSARAAVCPLFSGKFTGITLLS